MTEKQTCPTCGGSGEWHRSLEGYTWTDDCPTCHGTGKVDQPNVNKTATSVDIAPADVNKVGQAAKPKMSQLPGKDVSPVSVEPAKDVSSADSISKRSSRAEPASEPINNQGERPMKYRKKPVVIEAKKLTPDSFDEVTAWCGGVPDTNEAFVTINTLEGAMKAQMGDYVIKGVAVGDYVIKGVAGEFYPCKPDIFEATYEPAE